MERVTIEYFPVIEFLGDGAGGDVVMQFYCFGVEMGDDFCHENWMWWWVPASEKSLAMFLLGLDRGTSSTQLYIYSSYSSFNTLYIIIINVTQIMVLINYRNCSPEGRLKHFCGLLFCHWLLSCLGGFRNPSLTVWSAFITSNPFFYLFLYYSSCVLSFWAYFTQAGCLGIRPDFWS